MRASFSFVAALALTTFSLQSFALDGEATPAGWQLAKEMTEKTYSETEFKSLQAESPALLGHIDASSVVWAQIDQKKYEWTGVSTCPAGDARLSTVTKQVSYCLDKGRNGATACSMSSMPAKPLPTDPCAGG